MLLRTLMIAGVILASSFALHSALAIAKEPCKTVHCPKCRYCGCVRPPYGCSAGCHRFNGYMNQVAAYRQLETSWHGDYYHVAWGTPVSLVVPPTAEMQTDYHWGVGGTRITPIWHQYRPGFPGYAAPGVVPTVFLPTPRWPSDTNQFGVYYNRGPW